MSAAVLEQPPAPAMPEPRLDAIVRAYRIDRFFDNLDPDEMPEGHTAESLAATHDVGPAWYAEKHRDQVWPHIERWLREVPGCDVVAQIVEVPWGIWRDEMSGSADEVSE